MLHKSLAGVFLVSCLAHADYGYQFDSCQYPDGPLTLTAKAYDAAGNVGTNEIIVTIANRPTVAISYPLNGTKVAGQIVIQGSSASGCACTQMLIIDGKTVASGGCGAISYTWFATKAGKGRHTISLTAIDIAGNRATQQISVTV